MGKFTNKKVSVSFRIPNNLLNEIDNNRGNSNRSVFLEMIIEDSLSKPRRKM